MKNQEEETVKDIQVGCGQITWMKFSQAGMETTAPEEQILAEIAQAGYDGAPADPRKGWSAAETAALFAKHRLKPAPGYFSAEFWNPDRRADIVEQARQMAGFMHDVGCTELYVAAGGFQHVAPSGKARWQVAGHVSPADSLTDDEFQHFADSLNRVGEVTLAEGVRSCFHNHVGTPIETREEVDRLFELVDRDVVFMGPDTGHLAWAGADVVGFFRDYADSIKTVHLKDINHVVMMEGREKAWDYHTFTAHGIFAELGEGFVDFRALLQILEGAGFAGWLITETDVTQKSSPLESVTISREYLKALGI
jgi:inosose dehydratase